MTDQTNEIAQSLNPALERRQQLAALIPEAFSEGQLDVAALKRALGADAIIDGGERYALTWAGKANAYKVLQSPPSATLRPQRDLSINFDEAQHVFIEGENLEVLKVLQKAYFGKVKLIYIDPPYNTGSDSFIYPDRFQESKEDYLRRINDLSDDGTLMREGFFRKNSKESGHYHSNWLSMLLPRLYIARNLLLRDGVIVVSCDDNEVHNLKALLNEVFGEENWLAQITWEKGRKNDSTFFSESIEYMLVYARDRQELARKGKWRMEKLGADLVLNKYSELRKKYGDDHEAIEDAMSEFYAGLDRAEPAKQLSHFYRSDDRGLFFGGDISSASTSIPDYDIVHPVTGLPVKKPSRGWGCTEPVMKERMAEDRVLFGEDETTIPLKKNYLEETDSIVRTPVIYKDGRAASKVVKNLLGGQIFDNPKDHLILADIFEYAGVNADSDAIVLDFFGGSCSTAHAVLEMNAKDGGKRRFVCIQLPEECDERSSAFKKGFRTIAEIGRRRITAVIEKLRNSSDLLRPSNHLGFKSFVLTPSNFKQWRGDGIDTPEQLAEQMQMFAKAEKEGAEVEHILYELLLKFGQELITLVETLNIAGGKVFAIYERKMLFVLESFSGAMIQPLVDMKPREIIVIDGVFLDSDPLKSNLDLQCRDADIKFTCL